MQIAPSMAQPEAKIVVLTISVGAAEPYDIRMEMTVVGTSVKHAVFKASNVTIERLASSLPPFSRFNSSIALMPIGVAALPRPNTLAVMFDNI